MISSAAEASSVYLDKFRDFERSGQTAKRLKRVKRVKPKMLQLFFDMTILHREDCGIIQLVFCVLAAKASYAEPMWTEEHEFGRILVAKSPKTSVTSVVNCCSAAG